MKLAQNTKILIVGLGLIGGSYARGFSKRGYRVSAIDPDRSALEFALGEGFIEKGSVGPEPALLREADLVIFALYPHLIVPWVKENQAAFAPGTVLSDVTGVKACVVYDLQACLRADLEFIAAHPMAGREVSGVRNADDAIFENANFIVVPTDKNTFRAIQICRSVGETLGFARISSLPPRAHDEMIGFVSQLTHCIAICLMNCSTSEHLVDYTGDSFRDLTRIARINETMWSELFLLNKEALLQQMDSFMEEFAVLRELLANSDREGLKEKMRLSTARRALFDRPAEGGNQE